MAYQEFSQPMTLEQARETLGRLWQEAGEIQFGREMQAGSWDHRREIQAAMDGTLHSVPTKEGWKRIHDPR